MNDITADLDLSSGVSAFESKHFATAQRLLSPAEMGEFFKVIGFSKGGATIAALAAARPLPL